MDFSLFDAWDARVLQLKRIFTSADCIDTLGLGEGNGRYGTAWATLVSCVLYVHTGDAQPS